MRTIHIVAMFFALTAVSQAGCGVDVIHIEVVETGQAGGMAISFPGMGNFGSSLGSALSDKDVDPGDVDSMKVTDVTLELTSQGGLTDDLSFLKDLRFEVSAEGMGPEELASWTSFAEGDRKVDLEVASDLELKPYLKAGSMTVSLDAELSFPPPDVVDLQVTFKLRVDVDVI